MAKKHGHGFEMMGIVAIVAVVGLIIMFTNSENMDETSNNNLGGQAIRNTPPNNLGHELTVIDWGAFVDGLLGREKKNQTEK